MTGRPTTSDRLLQAFQVVHWRNAAFMIGLGFGAVFMFLPFLWMFASSMRPLGEAYGLPPRFWPERINSMPMPSSSIRMCRSSGCTSTA